MGRLLPLALVGCQIVERHRAADCRRFRDDRFGDGAAIKGIGPFRLEQSKGLGKIGIAVDLSRHRRLAVDIPGGDRVGVERRAAMLERQGLRQAPIVRDALRYREAVLGVVGGGLEGLAEAELAEALLDRVPAQTVPGTVTVRIPKTGIPEPGPQFFASAV